jgi:hypothetical protein
LIVHQFNTGSKGLTSPEYLKPTAPLKGVLAFLEKMIFTSEPKAVCIPDGAQPQTGRDLAEASGSADAFFEAGRCSGARAHSRKLVAVWRRPMAEFRKAARTEDVPAGQRKIVKVGGKRIALFNIDGNYYAIDDMHSQGTPPL